MTKADVTKAGIQLALCRGHQQWGDTAAIWEAVLRFRACMCVCLHITMLLLVSIASFLGIVLAEWPHLEWTLCYLRSAWSFPAKGVPYICPLSVLAF